MARAGARRTVPAGPYLQGLLVFVVPNVLFTGSLQFALATATRSLVATYASVVGMFVAYGVAGNLLADIENETLASMLDPFGGGAFGIATRYWTVAERNTMLLPVDGALLANRLVVLGLAVLVFAAAYRRFSFTVVERRPGRRWRWWRLGAPTRRPGGKDSGAPSGDAVRRPERRGERRTRAVARGRSGACRRSGSGSGDAALLRPPPARAADAPGGRGRRPEHGVPGDPGVRRSEHARQLVDGRPDLRHTLSTP